MRYTGKDLALAEQWQLSMILALAWSTDHEHSYSLYVARRDGCFTVTMTAAGRVTVVNE